MLSIPLDADGIRLDVLARTLAATTPAFVYVVPTYQNPTGSILPEAARRELVQLAQHHRTLIVEDLTPTLGTGLGLPPPIGAFASPDRVVTIGSLSKGGWGGLRIGWVRADRTIVMRLAAAKAIDDHGSIDTCRRRSRSGCWLMSRRTPNAFERESLLRREAAAAAIREQLPGLAGHAVPRRALPLGPPAEWRRGVVLEGGRRSGSHRPTRPGGVAAGCVPRPHPGGGG